MSRELIGDTTRAISPEMLRLQARKIGRIGQAIEQLTSTLHDIAPAEWYQQVSVLTSKLSQEVDMFDGVLERSGNTYLTPEQRQQFQQFQQSAGSLRRRQSA